MNKGFATILVAASVFLVAIVLLSQGSTQDISYNQNFSEIKVVLTNYNIVMLQAAQDCNWEKNVTEIDACLNTNSQNVKQIFDGTNRSCQVRDFSSRKDNNTAQSEVVCQIVVDLGNDGFFSLDVNKLIEIKKFS